MLAIRSDDRPIMVLAKNEKSPLDLSVKQGQIGGWEFARLSFPRWLFGAHLFQGAASFPTLFSTASGVFGLVAGPLSLPFLRNR